MGREEQAANVWRLSVRFMTSERSEASSAERIWIWNLKDENRKRNDIKGNVSVPLFPSLEIFNFCQSNRHFKYIFAIFQAIVCFLNGLARISSHLSYLTAKQNWRWYNHREIKTEIKTNEPELVSLSICVTHSFRTEAPAPAVKIGFVFSNSKKRDPDNHLESLKPFLTALPFVHELDNPEMKIATRPRTRSSLSLKDINGQKSFAGTWMARRIVSYQTQHDGLLNSLVPLSLFEWLHKE